MQSLFTCQEIRNKIVAFHFNYQQKIKVSEWFAFPCNSSLQLPKTEVRLSLLGDDHSCMFGVLLMWQSTCVNQIVKSKVHLQLLYNWLFCHNSRWKSGLNSAIKYLSARHQTCCVVVGWFISFSLSPSRSLSISVIRRRVINMCCWNVLLKKVEILILFLLSSNSHNIKTIASRAWCQNV